MNLLENIKLIKSLTIRQEGKNVLLLSGGVLIGEMTWQAADQLSKAFANKARAAEEITKAERIISDQALLTRIGFPIGLSNHHKIKEEAKKEALYNKILRRAIRVNKGKEVFGTPTIKRGIQYEH